MKSSLQGKLILSYLAVALITVLVVSVLVWLTSGQSLMNLVMQQQTALLSESVQAFYTANGSLDGFFLYYLQTRPTPDTALPVLPTDFAELPGDAGAPPGPDQPRFSGKPFVPHELRGVQGVVDADYRAVTPFFGHTVGQAVPTDRLQNATPVEVDGQTIAWILPDTSLQFKLSAEESLYQQRTTLAIGLAALAGILAAVAMGFFLSSRLLKPIQRLITAYQALARGDLQLQVLKNLVKNSLRCTPQGGSIPLSVMVAEQVQIRVSDSGAGIDPEDLPYVFDRFYRADKDREPTSGKMGLGLAICKALVTAQAGRIVAESTGKDQGTTIVITFDPVSNQE